MNRNFVKPLCVLLALFSTAIALSAEPSVSAGSEPSPLTELQQKQHEIAGQYTAAKEALEAVAAQLVPSRQGSAERIRLEAEQAKLQVQTKHLSEQLQQIDNRLAESQREVSPQGGGPSTVPGMAADGQASQPSPRVIGSEMLIISWSEAKDVAWGFSKPLGRWARQELNPPALASSFPTVGQGSVAVWQVGPKLYAFSGAAGRWDVLRLPDGHEPSFSLDRDYILAYDGDDVYTFAGTTGRWSSPKEGAAAEKDAAIGTEVRPIRSEIEEAKIKVFTLRHLPARDAERIVTQLFPRDIKSAAADERTNSLIVRGSEEQFNVIYHILTRLDEEQSQKSVSPAAGAASQTAGVASQTDGATLANVTELTRRFGAKDRQSLELARQMRELRAGGKPDQAQLDGLAAELLRVVGEAFALRQQLHHAELGQLQQRVAGIQQSLHVRDRLSDRIIERRLQDLLNPDLKWNDLQSTPAARAARSAALPAGGAMERTSGDGFNQRAELFANLEKNRTWVDNAQQDIARATTDERREHASEVKLSLLRNIMIILLQLRQAGEANEPEIAAAQAQIDKAEAEMAAVYEASNKAAASTPAETAAAREYRDLLQQRYEQLASIHQQGRVETAKILAAIKELHDADLAAATNADERHEAREQLVERMKQLKKIVDAKFQNEVEPEHGKLAVDAELLRAEAALAADHEANDTGRPGGPPNGASNAGSGPGATANANDLTRGPQPRVTYGDETTNQLAPLLGLSVAPVSREEASHPKYVGSSKITAIAPDSPVDKLRVGDIIVGATTYGQPPNVTKIQLNVLRGEALLPTVTVEFPTAPKPTRPAPASTLSQEPRSAAETASVAAPQTQLPLRTAGEFRERLQGAEAMLKMAQQEDAVKFGGPDAKTPQEQAQAKADNIAFRQRQLDFVREELAAQLRLLELEIADAKSAVAAARNEREQTESLIKSGVVSPRELVKPERAVEAATLRLERAQTILDLYRKADPRTSPEAAADKPPEQSK